MKRTRVLRSIALALAVLAAASQVKARQNKTSYPSMAPLEEYLMPDRNAEIKLARSAAPESISRDAKVLVLGKKGYEIAVPGKNGFVCMVDRGWTAGIDDSDFWNPKSRGPMCLNALAAKFYVPSTMKKTEMAIAGRTKKQMFEAIAAAIDKKELPAPEPGAMCYMLSKQGYLGDKAGGPWRPHLMFFTPTADSTAWGADLPGSPIFAAQSPEEHLTTFMIPVALWSDGTPGPAPGHSH
jgi:hypothetical protein